jgi:hypothetical protein
MGLELSVRVGPQDDSLGEYPMNEDRTCQVAGFWGFNPEPGRFYYYLELFQPLEDDGLQQIASPAHRLEK